MRRSQLPPYSPFPTAHRPLRLPSNHNSDVKSQNAFLTPSGLLKLGDFGVSKVLEGADGARALAATAVGTPYYLSPEICQGRKYGYKVSQ